MANDLRRRRSPPTPQKSLSSDTDLPKPEPAPKRAPGTTCNVRKSGDHPEIVFIVIHQVVHAVPWRALAVTSVVVFFLALVAGVVQGSMRGGARVYSAADRDMQEHQSKPLLHRCFTCAPQ
jgi:hypothetical protein